MKKIKIKHSNPSVVVPGIEEYLEEHSRHLRIRAFPKPKKLTNKPHQEIFKLIDGKATHLNWPPNFSEEGWERGNGHK